MARQTGSYETITLLETPVQAFIPYALPPLNPDLDWAPAMPAVQSASIALAKLAGMTGLVASTQWLVYGATRKEALLSSEIEGTKATMSDIISAEAGIAMANADDVEEVTNYLAAFEYARSQISDPSGLGIGMRLFNNTHQILMNGARGRNKAPGEVRRSQNWIGGSTPKSASLIPPPPHRVDECLSNLEKYILYSTGGLQPHEAQAYGHLCNPELPALIRIALIHAQFEMIHPYLDGNGRLGRLLIAILLEAWGQLSQPLLPISSYLKQHQADYYARLSTIRTQGDWEGWVGFFLSAVEGAAEEAQRNIVDIAALIASDRKAVMAHPEGTMTTLRLFEELPTMPKLTTTAAAERLGITFPPANKAIANLVDCGVLQQEGEGARNRTFVYGRYLELLAR